MRYILYRIKKGISRFKVDLLIYGLIVLTAFSSLYWQHAPRIFCKKTLSKKYLIANVIRGFSVTSIPIMLLLLGYFMTRIRKIGIFKLGVFSYRNLVLLVSSMFLQDSTWIGHFYNALFPFLRNTSPLFSGILLAILTNKIVAERLMNNRYAYYIFSSLHLVCQQYLVRIFLTIMVVQRRYMHGWYLH